MAIKQIVTRIAFTQDHMDLIDHLKPIQGHEWQGKLQGKSWGSRTKRDELKSHIKQSLTNNQGLVCAYCGLKLKRTSGIKIDHIAPKALHPEFMFEGENLAFSCEYCNGFEKKGDIDTVVTKDTNNYRRCTFTIVHPYYDDPAQHFDYLHCEGIPCLIKFLTPKAEESNRIFKLDSPEMTQERYKEGLAEILPLPQNLETLLKQVKENKYLSN